MLLKQLSQRQPRGAHSLHQSLREGKSKIQHTHIKNYVFHYFSPSLVSPYLFTSVAVIFLRLEHREIETVSFRSEIRE